MGYWTFFTWFCVLLLIISCFLNSLRKLYCFDAKFRDHSINNRLIRSNHESTNLVFTNFFHPIFLSWKRKQISYWSKKAKPFFLSWKNQNKCYILKGSVIVTNVLIHEDRIFWRQLLENKEMTFKNVKNDKQACSFIRQVRVVVLFSSS